MRRLAVVVLAFFVFGAQVAPAADFRFSSRPNKADLIHWRQWSQTSFSEAKKLHKPVLLALSAVWCHWCHVMDETTYSDADVIAYINENFIPVRVDSDMRPDIDDLYNQGGWPSTLVLTPEGRIVRAGTYILPEDMVSWLKKGVAEFRNKGHGIGEGVEEKPQRAKEKATGEADLKMMLRLVRSDFDSQHGGFGTPQKFPNPERIRFLLSEFTRSGNKELKKMITLTLDGMASGKIHDNIAGGFFRYSTRPDWSSPHYEKMLDLNAGLARNYASAYMVFGKKTYRKVLIGTVGYIMNNLHDPKTGAFYGSQDADNNYYTAKKRSGPSPRIDTNIYAGPNARMISALVAASGATGSGEYLKQAEKTAGFMLRHLYSEKEGVYRYYRDGEKHLPGLLADNVLFGSALIDLYDATGDGRYIETAGNIARLLAEKFFDHRQGLFRTSVAAAVVRPSEPGGLMEYNAAASNLSAAVFLLRISGYREEFGLKDLAVSAIARENYNCETVGLASSFCGEAYAWQLLPPLEALLVTAGKPETFLEAVNSVFVPLKVVRVLSLKKDKAAITRLGYPMEECLYLCSGKRCYAAVTKPGEVAPQIKRYLKSLK